MPRVAPLFACCLLPLAAGCPGKPAGQGAAPTTPPAGTALQVVVVGDPELAAAVGQLEGEWNAETGLAYDVRDVPDVDDFTADQTEADAILCPSHALGPLAEADRVRPVPGRIIEDDVGRLSEVFSLLRVHELRWGTRTQAIPLGSPIFVCYYRADLFERLGLEPPGTWGEYQEIAKLLDEDESVANKAPATPEGGPWCGAMEPLGPGWAGIVLLARAAAYASHPEVYSTLFDLETMDALVDGPPFVRALDELVAAAPFGPENAGKLEPDAVRAAFWRGECGMAMSWPTPAARVPQETPEGLRVGFAELPGSQDVYNTFDGQWETRPEDVPTRVPLLGAAGRLGVVSRGSPWPEASFQLLLWLSESDVSRQISTKTPAATLFRKSQTARPTAWVEPLVPATAAAEYAALVDTALSRGQCLVALRLPGRAEYLASLDGAVRTAVSGKQSSQEALTQAASEWQKITDARGRDSQRKAYLHSLGEE